MTAGLVPHGVLCAVPPTQDGVRTVPGFLAVGDLTGGSKE
jgi:hypothetical protein